LKATIYLEGIAGKTSADQSTLIKRFQNLIQHNDISHVLNLCQPIDTHKLSETIRIVNDFTTGINKLAKSLQQLILIICTLNSTAAPIDCGMFLKLVISKLQP